MTQQAPDQPRFVRASPNGKRIRCTICGRTGWGDPDPDPSKLHPKDWRLDCLGDHPFPCSCGRRFPTLLSRKSHVRFAKGEHAEVEP